MAPTATTSPANKVDSDFLGIPPFPNDVPTAPLLRLSLSALRSDPGEAEALFKASKELGFFYLDMRGDELGEHLLAESDSLFAVGKELFNVETEELMNYDYSKGEKGPDGNWLEGRAPSYMGYKHVGKGVTDKDGNRDRNEFYNTPKDDLLDLSPNPYPHPAPLQKNKATMARYTRHAHELLKLLLTHLNDKLELPPNTLEPYHALEIPSGDHIRVVHSPVQPPSDLRTALGAHTDFGSLTLLFNRLGGLQVLLPPSIRAENVPENAVPSKTGTWAYVRPLPGHAVINIADALVKFSGGILRSNIHRVASPPGKQSECERYSLVYFMRPGDNVRLHRLEGGIIPPLSAEEKAQEEDVTALQWINDKATAGMRKGEERDKARITNKAELDLPAE